MKNFSPENNLPNKKELYVHYFNRLNLLLNDFSDEIPGEVIHSFTAENKFKVRAAWWSSVTLNIVGLKKADLITEDLMNEYNQILYFHQKNLDETGLTAKKDIEEINLFIRKVIQYLENLKVD